MPGVSGVCLSQTQTNLGKLRWFQPSKGGGGVTVLLCFAAVSCKRYSLESLLVSLTFLRSQVRVKSWSITLMVGFVVSVLK